MTVLKLEKINILQILIGLIALIIGTLVYLVDRPPDQTYFVKHCFINISLYKTLPNIFRFVGNNLPAFIHVFSFILITAGLISCRKKGYILICLSWFTIDFACELGQKFNTWSVCIIPEWFAKIPILESTKNYFFYGTFDFFDLVAIILGSLIAYFLLIITMENKDLYNEKGK